jgi:hypothetical protein
LYFSATLDSPPVIDRRGDYIGSCVAMLLRRGGPIFTFT